MPVATLPPVPRWVVPSPTKEDLDWEQLPVIDFSQASTPEGRAELAPRVRDVMRTVGFMCIVNHGLTQSQTARMFDIGDVVFSKVPEEEKLQYASNLKEDATRIGYKPRQVFMTDNGVRDQHEQYAVHRTVFDRQKHPKALEPFLPELRAFAEHNHYNVLHQILRLLALGMEIPEETFVKMHGFGAAGDSHVRWIKYYPLTEEDEVKTNHVWLRGHTDAGTVTILYSQPIAALQIQSPDTKWRWIKHIDNALVVNIGTSMEILSGGFYKATIHRVVQPPADQRGLIRLGMYYFALADDDVKLAPVESSVLKQEGEPSGSESGTTLTMGEFRKMRYRAFGLKEAKRTDTGKEEHIIVNGVVVVKYYN
ncbi:Clavaminate synthase-like protein [Dichomitus squalens]|uniref:Clavaminate synthase-like protein n=1 Tax=Dichomitus squalens (strain LYAD-421) TaxID=732165 RepID=R7SVK3_DICSQ|nr:Clavaminate synthase-like protein [Dichomitus squalens LYAD-421 SS1]EJF59958.1 Clavaminate synthase-like protein [Dichomitus squalens LYAD-421 SS1]TBU40204.1 Clavaminate synthase-like protein [Dichomitus squalens]